MYGNDSEAVTDRCLLFTVPGHRIQRTCYYRFSCNGASGSIYLLHCTCSIRVLTDGKNYGRFKSTEIL